MCARARVCVSEAYLVRSWAGLLLSAVARMQVAVPSGFAAKDLIGPMSEAVNRPCARTAHTHEPSKRRVGFIVRKLPIPKHQAMLTLHRWLLKCAFWDGPAYTSWHILHGRDTPHSENCGSWCFDSPNLVFFLINYWVHPGAGVAKFTLTIYSYRGLGCK